MRIASSPHTLQLGDLPFTPRFVYSSPVVNRREFCRGVTAATVALGGNAAPPPRITTVTGPTLAEELGTTLVHEHIIADLRPLGERNRDDYNRDHAIETCLPYLRELREAGCHTVVEPSPMLVRRDPGALRILSEESGLQIICSTGIYGAIGGRFVPSYAHTETAKQLADRYVREIRQGIAETNVRAGFIKSGVNPTTPLPSIERKLVRAAALAQKSTGAALGIHSGPAAPLLEELEILEVVGVRLSRFVWIHAQAERDRATVLRIARRGVWISYDGINPQNPEAVNWIVECVIEMGRAGLLERVLISQDAGWYQPGKACQEDFRPFTGLFTDFLPKLRQNGFGQSEIDRLLIENPRRMLTAGIA